MFSSTLKSSCNYYVSLIDRLVVQIKTSGWSTEQIILIYRAEIAVPSNVSLLNTRSNLLPLHASLAKNTRIDARNTGLSCVCFRLLLVLSRHVTSLTSKISRFTLHFRLFLNVWQCVPLDSKIGKITAIVSEFCVEHDHETEIEYDRNVPIRLWPRHQDRN